MTDGISQGTVGRAYFEIEPVNDAPLVQSEVLFGAVEDNQFLFNVGQLMKGVTDVEMASPYEQDSVHFAGGLSAEHGSLVWDRATDNILYTPNRDFSGLERFSYQVADAQGAVTTGVSGIYVQPVNDAPLTQSDYGEAAEEVVWNNYRISALLGNDYDADGDQLSLVNPQVSQGRAQVRISNGNLSVRPAEGMAGRRIVVDYTVSDGHGGETPSQLIINRVLDHNYAPSFTGLYRITNQDIHGSHGDEDGWQTFSFHVEDKNGGNSWSYDWGDIMAIHGALGSSTSYGKHELFDYGNGHFKFGFDRMPGSRANMHITAVDYQGATGTITVNLTKLAGAVGIHRYSPVVFDLEGDGLELLALDSGPAFDWNRDGVDEKTGWISGRDAFLAYDYNGDRMIDRADELMLSEYTPGAMSDLEGLRSFDTNKDQVFDSQDGKWSSFGLWQDKNSNGVTDTGEFRTLDEAGIAAIDLRGEEGGGEQAGGSILGTVIFTRTDGSTGTAADVALYGEEFALEQAGSEDGAAGSAGRPDLSGGSAASSAGSDSDARETLAGAGQSAGGGSQTDSGAEQSLSAESGGLEAAAGAATADDSSAQESLAGSGQSAGGADASEEPAAAGSDSSAQESLVDAGQTNGGEGEAADIAVPACCSEAQLNTLSAQIASDLAMAPEDSTAQADAVSLVSPADVTSDIHQQLDDFQDNTSPFG